MLNPSEIKEKIEEVTRKISQLKTSKTESEKKRKKAKIFLNSLLQQQNVCYQKSEI